MRGTGAMSEGHSMNTFMSNPGTGDRRHWDPPKIAIENKANKEHSHPKYDEGFRGRLRCTWEPKVNPMMIWNYKF
jgi:hypothetical protein